MASCAYQLVVVSVFLFYDSIISLIVFFSFFIIVKSSLKTRNVYLGYCNVIQIKELHYGMDAVEQQIIFKEAKTITIKAIPILTFPLSRYQWQMRGITISISLEKS